jgi:nucleoside-diphosphate-sugar epimerase
MKKVLVTGSAGFIGGHLVRKLQSEGHWVVGADIVEEKYCKADRFYQYDLRKYNDCIDIFETHSWGDEALEEISFDEVYNLACLMGGMGWIGDEKHSYDIMVGSSQIIINVLEAAIKYKAKKIFFSSSACVYNESYQLGIDNCSLAEHMAYPSLPDLTYGWQKLFSERLMLAAKDKIDIRIARFHNIFGIEGTWDGGKEKFPAAISRKVAQAKDGDTITIWGDGLQTRSYLNVTECLRTVELLMQSNISEPLNIGSDELISCNDLAKMVIEISGKNLKIEHDLTKPQGVRGRNSDNKLIQEKLGYAPVQDLKAEMTKLYGWVLNETQKQVHG